MWICENVNIENVFLIQFHRKMVMSLIEIDLQIK